MSKTEKRVEAVAALIAERRKYEGWLAALEAKRAETPDHVFLRVRSDYERRLSEVLEQLRSQASALSDRADALTTRLAALVEEERASRDRRHEAELRVSVGEFSQKAWEDLVKETTEITNRITAERTTIQAELAEIRELLGGGKGAAPGKTGERPQPRAPARTESAAEPPMVVTQSTEPPELPPDELAFLHSLITPDMGSKAVKVKDTPPAPVVPSPSAARVKEAEPLLDPHRSGRDTPPLSMESEAIVIQSDKDRKTLKCGECGALNVPTEWYCEHCGSELEPT
jgi:hypothetical protein